MHSVTLNNSQYYLNTLMLILYVLYETHIWKVDCQNCTKNI